MEFRDNPSERLFREEVREWLRSKRPKDLRPSDDDIAGQMAFDRGWQRAQFDGGWAGISWPKKHGGRCLTPIEQLIWSEEYASAECPLIHDSVWMALNHAGHTLIHCGTDKQKAFHLPRILKGEATWCQGFSQPNAGSDMLSLQTRGEIDGDQMVVNGQKTWTTYAHLADYCELLVRTGKPGGRHKGLTWIIGDMHADGVTVRPMTALDGHLHNSECFFDDVRIPLDQVVGGIDQGWSVVLKTLEFERGGSAFPSFCQMAIHLEQPIAEARQVSAGRMLKNVEDPGGVNPDLSKRLIFALLDFPIPLIAKLNGHAVGLGATCALFCDVIFASEKAKIADPHVKIGLSAGDGGAIIWPQLIGYARAREFLMCGTFVSAQKAADIGLINYCLPHEELDAAVDEFVANLQQGALKAICATKKTVNLGLKQVASAVMDASIAYETLTIATQDHAEAVHAFLEKREPKFIGK